MSEIDVVMPSAPRADHRLIAEMVEPGSRVLDVGCGDGALLQLLRDEKAVDGRGIELSPERVKACVTRGLSVIQGDADRDLPDYPDKAFDYAVLSLTIQATRFPKTVLENLLRIGRHAIVSFPNFGHWRIRTQLMMTGRMPMTPNLPETWYNSVDAHLCTIKDFASDNDPCTRVDEHQSCHESRPDTIDLCDNSVVVSISTTRTRMQYCSRAGT